jgi:glutamine amidotransferase
MLTIIDYGIGNVGSILNMIKKVGGSAQVTSDAQTISKAEKLILPGVGAFDRAVTTLESLNIKDIIIEKAMNGTPLLGICLGMQLLAESSEEGVQRGLALIPGNVVRFNIPHPLKVPHMGWNKVQYSVNCPLFKGFDLFDETRFYFVHSYYFNCQDSAHISGATTHGITFASSVQKGSVFGVQFHPEKSHKFGMKLFDNFINYAGC